jgi:large subunit ribosomal protein L25
MSNIVLIAQNRTKTGSIESRRLRRAGRLPAVMYGRTGQACSIDIDTNTFVITAKSISKSTILTIQLDGTDHEVFVKETQRNIINGNILHVDFYEVERGVALRTKVDIHTHGSPVGIRNGGILELPVHEIEVECLPKDLPERIDVDISTLDVNQSIHIRDLSLGESVRVISGLDQVVALIKFAKAEAASAATESDAEGTAATPAPSESKS